VENYEAQIYSKFYLNIQSKLRKYFIRKLRTLDSGVADDLTQQAFEIFFKKINDLSIVFDKSLDDPGIITQDGRKYKIEGYLFGVARNLYREYIKKNYPLKLEVIDEENDQHSSNTAYYPEIETKILLNEFWALLNIEEKYIFELKLFGYNYQEISGKFKTRFGKRITEENLRKIFQRKIRQLAKKYL
jgi:DNA-directed RNA polymerase specialized sigma24 family protein